MEENPVQQAAAEIERVAAAPKQKRQRKPKDEPQTAAPDPAVPEEGIVITFNGIEASDISKAVNALLQKLAQKSKTEPPSPEEVDSIATATAFGLKNMKIAISPKSGPWVPLGIAAVGYAAPRLIDAISRAMEAREAAKSGPFPEGASPIHPSSNGKEP